MVPTPILRPGKSALHKSPDRMQREKALMVLAFVILCGLAIDREMFHVKHRCGQMAGNHRLDCLK